MLFPSIIVHSMITYTLYTPLNWKSTETTETSISASYLLSRFITFCDWWDRFNQVVWQTWRLRFPCRKLPLHLPQCTRVSSLWCFHLATYKIYQRLLFLWLFYRHREATHWKACWSVLYAWKIEHILSKVLWSIKQWSGTTLQYSPFAVIVWPSPLLVCVTYPGFDPTG